MEIIIAASFGIYLLGFPFIFCLTSGLLASTISKHVYKFNLSFDLGLKFIVWLLIPILLLGISITIGFQFVTINMLELWQLCILNISYLLAYFIDFTIILKEGKNFYGK